jgi:hypothetical protein
MTRYNHSTLKMSQKQDLLHSGITFPRQTLKKLDQLRGPYLSRNKFMLKIIEEYLKEQEEQKGKGVEGSHATKLESHQPTPTSPTPNHTQGTTLKEVMM